MSTVKHRLCLNMIVKNESHIIQDTLSKLLNKVPFDYWVISDTGSTDNTQQMIIDFFKEKNIQGELFQDAWQDFGYNRTKALEHAFGKSEYVIIFDADDEICGNFILPSLTSDSYQIQFGDANGTSYLRTQIINNNKRWKYVGVLHEYITCIDPVNGFELISGDYYTVSGRTSNRNSDKDKYLKDALILEEAYSDAFQKKDDICNRYAFYCANSYNDCGRREDAIRWYKKTLDGNNWNQEKYISCLNLYHSYNALNQKELGMFYLVKAFSYDNQRAECVYELVSYYCANNMNEIAYGYYSIVKSFYENTFLISNLQNKLFLDVSKANFFLPYYMIIVADKVKDIHTGVLMYRIIFTKKHIETSKFFIGNMLYNLQFFIDAVKNDTEFLKLFNEYIDFLLSINYPVYTHECMGQYAKYGISNNQTHISKFSRKDCSISNKILIYVGFMDKLWNDTYISHHSLGGSEKAVAYLSRYLPKNYDIYISGDVEDEVVGNITYINRFKLQTLLDTEKFHTIIVSRYVSFFLLYPRFSCYNLFLSAHDCNGFLNNYNDVGIDQIISKWNNEIDGVICLTNWHKNNIIETYPVLQNKMHIVNNGILTDLFSNRPTKTKNKFVWTSCSARGLSILLHLWEDILTSIPDATLDISSYDTFPKDANDQMMLDIINKHESIMHHGKLNTEQLYNLISTAEYWLYTTNFCETSCITALEMLMSEVICIYYPLAGLVDTLGDYGIQVKSGDEITTILNLTEGQKINTRKKGKEYAMSCSWENRAKQWANILFDNKKQMWAFYHNKLFDQIMISQYIDNLNSIYPDYQIVLTCDREYIIKNKPHKLTYIYDVFDIKLIVELPDVKPSILNTEPLNIPCRLNHIVDILRSYPDFDYYDYSKSNLTIIENANINVLNKIYLPYICNNNELCELIELNRTTNKIFDFGIIKAAGGDVTDRRQAIINYLKQHNISVNIIGGWGKDRDVELAKCKVILNIHGFFQIPSNIFEHIRCDRLLEAGFTILSESSYKLDPAFIAKYPRLNLIDYNAFFNIDNAHNVLNARALTNHKYGFIILRHVNSKLTNNYWNNCYKSIRKHYPDNLIIIIDDNSDYAYITEQQTVYNTTIIQSEYYGRGELLPYFYYLQNKLFDTAVILHDSVFINTYIDIRVDKYKMLWDFEHDWDQIEDETNMINLFNDAELLAFYENKRLWTGCFGGMSIITHDYLTYVNNKYDISKLLNVVKNRYNRCSFERVIACLLQKNEKKEVLLGNIHKYCKWGISMEEADNYKHLPLVKVWTGR